MKSQILIGCGSNLKNPLFQLSKALHLLSAKNYITLYAVSPIYITEPLGYKKQADFFNCVVSIKTRVKAHSLLKILLNLEKKMGRTRLFKNAPRVIDLDLLIFRNEKKIISRLPYLSLPHPEMLHRKFVLQPISDLDTHIKIPGKRSLYCYLKNTRQSRNKKISQKNSSTL
ncbi:MAG: 2-amino-4-hydroxy-6-hydroxymethyldihydropteridine diphosphokinase [Burkholderiaceae bacterium]|nr:MAG: 2-amino-4-hydroxy-6-hydroxymethyldihydropteridine diphosphokinase [Burkholderiaceae bacterium]